MILLVERLIGMLIILSRTHLALVLKLFFHGVFLGGYCLNSMLLFKMFSDSKFLENIVAWDT